MHTEQHAEKQDTSFPFAKYSKIVQSVIQLTLLEKYNDFSCLNYKLWITLIKKCKSSQAETELYTDPNLKAYQSKLQVLCKQLPSEHLKHLLPEF